MMVCMVNILATQLHHANLINYHLLCDYLKTITSFNFREVRNYQAAKFGGRQESNTDVKFDHFRTCRHL